MFGGSKSRVPLGAWKMWEEPAMARKATAREVSQAAAGRKIGGLSGAPITQGDSRGREQCPADAV